MKQLTISDFWNIRTALEAVLIEDKFDTFKATLYKIEFLQQSHFREELEAHIENPEHVRCIQDLFNLHREQHEKYIHLRNKIKELDEEMEALDRKLISE